MKRGGSEREKCQRNGEDSGRVLMAAEYIIQLITEFLLFREFLMISPCQQFCCDCHGDVDMQLFVVEGKGEVAVISQPHAWTLRWVCVIMSHNESLLCCQMHFGEMVLSL